MVIIDKNEFPTGVLACQKVIDLIDRAAEKPNTSPDLAARNAEQMALAWSDALFTGNGIVEVIIDENGQTVITRSKPD